MSLGMDGLALLRTEDPVERTVQLLVAERAAEHHATRDRARAVAIANAVGQLFR